MTLTLSEDQKGRIKSELDLGERDSGLIVPPPLTIRSVSEAVRTTPAPPDYIVGGFMRRGELMAIAANRALGKSWFGMQLAYRIGTGIGSFCDHLPIIRSARVLYCHGEIDPEVAHERWHLLTGGNEAPNLWESFDQWRLRVVTKRTSAAFDGLSETVTYSDAQLDERIEGVIRDKGIEVLIIDPWKTFFSGSENSNDEAEAALDKLRYLAVRYGTAIVIIHHISKTTDVREPEDSWRGASRLADWASTRVTLVPHYTEQQARAQGMTRQDSRRYVDVKLLRRHEPTPDFSIHRDDDQWWRSWDPPDEGAQPKLALHDVMFKLTLAGGRWESIAQAAADLGVSQSTAKRFLDTLVGRGNLVRSIGRRNAIGYCQAGREISPDASEDF